MSKKLKKNKNINIDKLIQRRDSINDDPFLFTEKGVTKIYKIIMSEINNRFTSNVLLTDNNIVINIQGNTRIKIVKLLGDYITKMQPETKDTQDINELKFGHLTELKYIDDDDLQNRIHKELWDSNSYKQLSDIISSIGYELSPLGLFINFSWSRGISITLKISVKLKLTEK